MFYLSEIVKFAIEKEEQSQALYKKLAENAKCEKCKTFFEQLVKEEVKHEEFYSKMLETVADEQSPAVQEDDEYSAYMQEMIESARIAKTVEEIGADDMGAALDYAIAREKDSILFYTGMKNFVPAAAKEHIDVIIREEARHVAMLAHFNKNKC